jgi:2-phospho-L-lactate/phosphoenolpyruvate guanylyltransferase
MYSALVPVKFLSAAKSRLANHLSTQERESLVVDMLHHVVRVLQDCKLLDRVAVVSPDTRVLALAQQWGAQPLLEARQGHNAALYAAALQEQRASQAQGRSLDGLLTISADLPLLCSNDIWALIEQSARYHVVLAPSRDGTGTNALLVRPPLAVPYLFGVGSLQRYLDAAQQRHLSSTLYRSMGTALDIDTADDLHELEFVFCEAR